MHEKGGSRMPSPGKASTVLDNEKERGPEPPQENSDASGSRIRGSALEEASNESPTLRPPALSSQGHRALEESLVTEESQPSTSTSHSRQHADHCSPEHPGRVGRLEPPLTRPGIPLFCSRSRQRSEIARTGGSFAPAR